MNYLLIIELFGNFFVVKIITIFHLFLDPGLDDEIGHMETSDDGKFSISGSASDPIGSIDVVLKIYHSCKKVISIDSRTMFANYDFLFLRNACTKSNLTLTIVSWAKRKKGNTSILENLN